MTPSFPVPDIIPTLIQWANARTSIRAVLLTSTRAVPNAPVDILSDYDVILVVEDIQPFVNDRTWLNDFGEVLVVYWDQVHPDPVFGIEQCGNVTQYVSGLKIDFTLWSVAQFQQVVAAPVLEAELDAGYRVLLDKDHLADALPAPTGRAYIPERPTNEAFQTHINDFLTDPPYVAKCLWRDELLPAKWCLDYDMNQVYLLKMLEWYVGARSNWSIPVGSLGKGLKKRLPPEIWAQLEQTFAGADIEAHWEALAQSMELFRRVAVEVGNQLGYSYPHELHERVRAYVAHIRHIPINDS